MEPLIEENEKLKAAMNLMERNIQKAQRERDLAESNAQDLEYQKGILSERLATVSEQLWSKSEQLDTISEQLMGASEQLEQLRKVSKQKKGMLYRRMCFVLLNSYIFGDDCCACRARCRARPATLGPRTTPRGEGKGVKASRQTSRGAER